MPVTYYTKKEYDEITDISNAFSRMIGRLELNEGATQFMKEQKKGENKEEWRFIPYSNITTLARLFREIYKYRVTGDRYFLELGSGIGVKTKIASEIGYRAIGIEKNPELVKKAKQYWEDVQLGSMFLKFKKGDVMNSKKDIKWAKVIYTYSPFKTDEKCVSFIDYIVENMKKGSVLIYKSHKGAEDIRLEGYAKEGVLEPVLTEYGLFFKKIKVTNKKKGAKK